MDDRDEPTDEEDALLLNQNELSGPGSRETKPFWKGRIKLIVVIGSLIVVGLIILLSFFGKSDTTHLDWNNIRLPSHIKPTKYKIEILADLSELKFNGTVDMHLTLSSPSRLIVFHYAEPELVISKDITVTLQDSTATPFEIVYKPQLEFAVLKFKNPLPAGNLSLKVAFSGKLTQSLQGFYYSEYRVRDGKMKRIGTTQFESTDARRAFPCLDEPSMKATFELSIIAPPGYHVLSNMPIVSSSPYAPINLWSRFDFAESLKMSTYLVAFVISEFQAIETSYVTPGSNRNITVRVWTQPGKTETGRYALEVGEKVLKHYTDLFGIEYPLEKCDHVAIPDFAAGAMENWGLITYRDTALLYDPALSSALEKQWVATVVSHEVAHQWFGNLATMSWWSDLWLNEGFAEYMEYRGVAHVHPDWEMDTQFIANDLFEALDEDSSIFTHPIAANVSNPSEISDIFDSISYSKGASIIRMLQIWLDLWSKGTHKDEASTSYFFQHISAYLKKHSYENTVTKDLWDSLDGNGLDLANVMSTWTDQPGYPLITMELSEHREEKNTIMVAGSQKRFLISKTALNDAKALGPVTSSVFSNVDIKNVDSQTWKIPFSYNVYSNSSGIPEVIGTRTFILEKWEQFQALEKNSGNVKMVMKANVGLSGTYRVNYPTEWWLTMADWLLKHPSYLNDADRAGLLSDAWALSFSGDIENIEIPLKFLQTLYNEHSYVAWEAGLSIIREVRDALSRDPVLGEFNEYIDLQMRTVLDPIIHTIPGAITDDPYATPGRHVDKLIWLKLLPHAVEKPGAAVTTAVMNLFQQIMNTRTVGKLSADLLGVAYNVGVIHGGESVERHYEFILSRYAIEGFETEKKRLLAALAKSPVEYLQMRTLYLTLGKGNGVTVRRMDIPWLIAAVNANDKVAEGLVWTFLMDNWTELTRVWRAGQQEVDWKRMNKVLEKVVAKFTSRFLVAEAERVFVKRELGDAFFVPPRADVAVRKGMERALTKIMWREKNAEKIKGWLDLHIWD